MSDNEMFIGLINYLVDFIEEGRGFAMSEEEKRALILKKMRKYG